MTFRKRMVVMFATVIVVPMLLFSLAFVSLGNYLIGEKGELSGYTSIVGNYDTFDFDAVQAFQMAEQNPDQLQDVEFLQEIADKIHDMNVYLVVRRGEELYYASNETLAAADLSYLPAWEGEQRGEDSGQDGTLQGNAAAYEHRQTYAESAAVLTGQPGAGEEKKNGLSDTVQANAAGTQQQNQMIQAGKRSLLVRQLDFSFPDGAQGSLFIVMRIMGLISGKFLSGLFVSMLTILVFTAFLLTRWLESSIFTPISAINIAMNNIRDGNFTYTLSTGEEGEIGDLYRNYEDMRLRLKESADEKLEREKQNRELISNISHDLKTPITSIKGYVEGLIDGVANTPEKQEKYIRTIYNKANDMDHLIDELTLYSRFESDRIPYNFHRLNVADYFGDCVEEIGMDMEAKGIELNYTNLVSPQTKIIADPEQMKRVINNIVGNSVKYMDKEKGRIDIRILDEHDSVRIEIEDNGKGIGARDLPNIFDRFYRTDSSRNSSQGGSGIGLSIVRKIIEDHGGYIWATSREGEGTCMHFVIRKYVEQEDDTVESLDETEI
ncbi:MAG: HAMP domain-containing sensor histidine kinase [Lachnospiraceae bacterium]|nr:HAMP domain-containing sensor histidine kinase [Lachnospiraceae bacterium]